MVIFTGNKKSLYNTPRWQAIRRRQLIDYPLCAMCKDEGIVTAANICDHIERHGGDAEKFYRGPFQSLCKRCHDSRKQMIELRGYDCAIDADGFPTDTRHPFNKAR